MRSVYDMVLMEGISASRIESIASTNGGKRLFVGSNDGFLHAYEVRLSSDEKASADCNLIETLRRQSKDRRPVSSLKISEEWFVLIGIMDSMITAYDLSTYRVTCQLAETKGTRSYCISEIENLLCVVQSRRMSLYSRQGSSFNIKNEVQLGETPRAVLFTSGAIIVGYRRHYELMDLNLNIISSLNVGSAGSSLKILDIEREHHLVVVELPPSQSRPAVVALSIGVQNQAALVHIPTYSSSNSHSSGEPFVLGEKLEWSSPPLSSLSSPAHAPFVISLLPNGVEIHDMSNTVLTPIQKIFINSPLAICSYHPDPASTSTMTSPLPYNQHRPGLFVASANTVVLLRLIPISIQINALGSQGLFEEALSLLAASQVPIQSYGLWESYHRTRNTETSFHMNESEEKSLRRRYAEVLLQRGDVEGAIGQHIAADTKPSEVLRLFPDLVSIQSTTHPDVNRAKSALSPQTAPAIVSFCEHHREKVLERAERAESRISAVSVCVSGSSSGSGVGGLGLAGEDGADAGPAVAEATLLDTSLLHALLACQPPRKNAVVELLSRRRPRCRAQLESSTVLLSAYGLPFTEALLWLYRLHGEHQRVLAALTESRCVASGFWTREQFHAWTIEYLRSLWYSPGQSDKSFALTALKPLLEKNPDVGMEVLAPSASDPSLNPTRENTPNPLDIVSFLHSTSPVPRNLRSLPYTPPRPIVPPAMIPAGSLPIPLLSGRSMAVMYLEWLVSHGGAKGLIDFHDTYAQMLMEGIPTESTEDHTSNDLGVFYDPTNHVPSSDGTIQIPVSDLPSLLYKIYRAKLQRFLQSPSSEYRPEKVMKFLPTQFLHEYALLLSRLGKHEETLRVYIHQLRDLPLAESYCDRIHKSQEASERVSPGGPSAVYISLLKVILAADQKTFSSVVPGSTPLLAAIALAERYVGRVDPCAVIDVLPPLTPVATISRYLGIVSEYHSARKRNLQVMYQLLRVQEVRLRAGVTEALDSSLSRTRAV